MDTTSLKTFISVADLASFSEAAEQLFVTQPAISKRISTLETELNTQLFDRIGRITVLTESGRLLYQHAQHILLAFEDSKRDINNLSQQVGGTLNIATSHHIGLHRLPNILKTYALDYQQVEMDIEFMDSETACSNVIKGNIEIAITTLPTRDIPEIESLRLWPDPMAIVVGHSHSLCHSKNVSREDLLQHSAILPLPGTYTREIIEQQLADKKHSIHTRMSTNYLETIKMLVSVGMAWSVLPVSMLAEDLQRLHINGITLQRQLGVVWHASRTLSNAANAMLELLQQNSETSANLR